LSEFSNRPKVFWRSRNRLP